MRDFSTQTYSIPGYATLPINRCNLPAKIVGGITYQEQPSPIQIDGVLPTHQILFDELRKIENSNDRRQFFLRYMDDYFSLTNGYNAENSTPLACDRSRAHFLTLLRGWFFNTEGREAAILKGWVESRFGLIPRFHRGKILAAEDETYSRYMIQRCAGLYNTNALEAQVDLLYSYCQYEISLQFPNTTHIELFRGVNDFTSHEILDENKNHNVVLLLNNLNSFSQNKLTASEFGDTVYAAKIPLSKVLFFSNLLPTIASSEFEVSVIGGLSRVTILKT